MCLEIFVLFPESFINFNKENRNITVGNNEYIFIHERILLPIFKEFAPKLIIVSIGFDAMKGDPIGKL